MQGSKQRVMAATAQRQVSTNALEDRATLTLFLGEIAETANADFYMLMTAARRDGQPVGKVIASNWVFDAIELVGAPTLGSLARNDGTMFPGMRPRAIVTNISPAPDAALDAQAVALLHSLGHQELYCLHINVGRFHLHLLLSGKSGEIEAARLGENQMRCNYALSGMADTLRASILKSGLTDFERDCLAWAAEGKTSEDIAVILDVQAGVTNGAIAQAMEKLQARNRVEAVANAIRMGIL